MAGEATDPLLVSDTSSVVLPVEPGAADTSFTEKIKPARAAGVQSKARPAANRKASPRAAPCVRGCRRTAIPRCSLTLDLLADEGINRRSRLPRGAGRRCLHDRTHGRVRDQ